MNLFLQQLPLCMFMDYSLLGSNCSKSRRVFANGQSCHVHWAFLKTFRDLTLFLVVYMKDIEC